MTSHERTLFERVLPLLTTLGDYIGNGPINPERMGSLGERCDLIGDIKDALDSPRTAWALYCATPKHSVSGISLHSTRREALLEALSYAESGGNDYTPNDDPMSDEELADHVAAAFEEEGDEWEISEVVLP